MRCAPTEHGPALPVRTERGVLTNLLVSIPTPTVKAKKCDRASAGALFGLVPEIRTDTVSSACQFQPGCRFALTATHGIWYVPRSDQKKSYATTATTRRAFVWIIFGQ